MTDIVERLRLSVTKGHEPSDQDAIDAITEIERLQAENFALAADQCHAGYAAKNGDHRCNYQDVINELRTALGPFAEIAEDYDRADMLRTQNRRDEMGGDYVYRTEDSHRVSIAMKSCRRARAALEPKENGK